MARKADWRTPRRSAGWSGLLCADCSRLECKERPGFVHVGYLWKRCVRHPRPITIGGTGGLAGQTGAKEPPPAW